MKGKKVKMCEIVQDLKYGNLSLTCSKTKKPITISNEYGMYCNDMCGMQEDKQIMEQTMRVLAPFLDRKL